MRGKRDEEAVGGPARQEEIPAAAHPHELGEPGKADGVASGADRERIERAFDEAVAAGESTVTQLEAEIATLEAGHRQKQAEADALVAAIPVGRIGVPEDVAAAVVYLAAAEAGYVTGQTLHVNGGMAMI